MQLGERLDPALVGQRAAEAHGLEVDEARFEAARAAAQVDVRALEIAVVDTTAVQGDEQGRERVEHRGCFEPLREREGGRDAGAHVLEHHPGADRHACAAALEPRLGPRDTDPAQGDPVPGAPGAPGGRAAQHVGERAAEPAPRRLLHDEGAAAEHVARDARTVIVLQHARVRGRERLGVRGEQAPERPVLERAQAQPAQPLATHAGHGAPRPQQAPGAPARELLRAPVGGGARRPQRRARRRVEGPREPERGRAQAHALRQRDERPEPVLEAREVARAGGGAAGAARVLPVEHDRGAGADQEVPGVEVGVDPAGRVEPRHQRAERAEQRTARARRSRQQGGLEGHALDPGHREQAVAAGEGAERERLRHRQARCVQSGERAPLARGRRAADPRLHGFAPGMPPGSDAELFQQDRAPTGHDAQRAAPRVVRDRGDGAGGEGALEHTVEVRSAVAPPHASEARFRPGPERGGHDAGRRAPASRW
ncbi:MAG: hypothetical protein OZ948_08865 [Deltaproteobacteria bacterium]|nr:hypothetical protein [Deltaproteobacteria bacterium]